MKTDFQKTTVHSNFGKTWWCPWKNSHCKQKSGKSEWNFDINIKT